MSIELKWPHVYNEDGSVNSEAIKIYASRIPHSTGAKKDNESSSEEENESIQIVSPRIEQRTIAKGRDFYVLGYFNEKINPVIPRNAIFTVYVKKGDTILRKVSCEKKDDKEHLYANAPELIYFYGKTETGYLTDDEIEMVRNSCCPNLVYSRTDDVAVRQGKFPETLRDTWNKAYYTDCFFAALIYGGEYGKAPLPKDEIINGYGEDGRLINPLEEGDYTLRIELKSSANAILAEREISITIGNLPKKMLSPFSDTNHVDRMWEREEKNGEIIIWDPLPGYWASALMTDREDGKMKLRPGNNEDSIMFFGFSIGKARAAFNDQSEYRGGSFSFHNYAAMKRSYSVTLELAEIIRQNKLGANIPVQYFCYDGGAPLITGASWLDKPQGTDNLQKSNIIALDEKVKFLYVEIGEPSEFVENLSVLAELNRMTKKYRVEEGLSLHVKSGQMIRITGICKVPENQMPVRDEVFETKNIDVITNILYEVRKLNRYGNTVSKSTEIRHPGVFLEGQDPEVDKKKLQEERDPEERAKLEHQIMLKEQSLRILTFRNTFLVQADKDIKTIIVRGDIAYSRNSQPCYIGRDIVKLQIDD